MHTSAFSGTAAFGIGAYVTRQRVTVHLDEKRGNNVRLTRDEDVSPDHSRAVHGD